MSISRSRVSGRCSRGIMGTGVLAVAVAAAAAAPPPSGQQPPAAPTTRSPATTTAVAPVKTLLSEESLPLEREIATRMMRRADYPADKRARLELEIDLRIIERSFIALAADAKSESAEQAVAWLRAKQMREALHGLEEAIGRDAATAGTTPSQKGATAELHKLSYTAGDAKSAKELDAYCRAVALAMVNTANASPVSAAALPAMRPTPASVGSNDKRTPVGELTEQVQRLAAVSVPLRQQLLALAAAASAAGDSDEGHVLYGVLSQATALAQGLQSNTAVGPEARTSLETQLAEGLALFADPRTRDAGRTRIDALGQYRQILTRVGKMGLSPDQMSQLAPALAWCQANPEAGAKLMGEIEQYLQTCAKWDALPKDFSIPNTLRRPLEDLRGQFAKVRASFMQGAAKLGTIAGSPADFELALEDVKRLYAVAEDLIAMGMSIDTLNSLKIKPVGGLERKVTTAALAAVSATASTNRNDGQKYLNAVHDLADYAHRLAAHPLTDVPAAVLQGWAGGKIEPFENRWRAVVVDLAATLNGGAIELDKGKVIRLETAIAMGDALRTATQLEAALPKTAPLSRWVDWSIDPGSLQLVLTPYKDATAAAFTGYAADSFDAVDRWTRLHARYEPLVALVLRDVAYADQCEGMPIGFGADAARLAAAFDGAPFATERYASFAIGVWSALERTGDVDAADHVSVVLARRLARDLHIPGDIPDDATSRAPRRPRN